MIANAVHVDVNGHKLTLSRDSMPAFRDLLADCETAMSTREIFGCHSNGESTAKGNGAHWKQIEGVDLTEFPP